MGGDAGRVLTVSQVGCKSSSIVKIAIREVNSVENSTLFLIKCRRKGFTYQAKDVLYGECCLPRKTTKANLSN